MEKKKVKLKLEQRNDEPQADIAQSNDGGADIMQFFEQVMPKTSSYH